MKNTISVQTPSGLDSAEEMILAFMLKNRKAVDYFLENIGYLTSDNHNRIAMAIVDMTRRLGKVDTGQLIDLCESDSEKQIVTKLMSSWMYEVDYDEEVMKGAIRKVCIAQKRTKQKLFENNLHNQ